MYGSEASAWSEAIDVSMWVLQAPQNLKIAAVQGDSAESTWDEVVSPVGTAVTYEVKVKEVGKGSSPLALKTDTPHFTLECLEIGREYAVRVRAVCGGATSEWGDDALVSVKAIMCPAGHELEPYELEDSFRKYGTYRVYCENCRTYYIRGTPGMFYGCRPCGFDLCPACAKKPVQPKKKCPNGHDLAQVTVGQRICGTFCSHLTCDRCRKNLLSGPSPMNTFIFCCPACDFDLCEECAGKPVECKVLKCRNGHALSLITLQQRRYGRPFDTIMCERCRRGLNSPPYPGDYKVLSCIDCRYDLCDECAKDLGRK